MQCLVQQNESQDGPTKLVFVGGYKMYWNKICTFIYFFLFECEVYGKVCSEDTEEDMLYITMRLDVCVHRLYRQTSSFINSFTCKRTRCIFIFKIKKDLHFCILTAILKLEMRCFFFCALICNCVPDETVLDTTQHQTYLCS